MLAYIFYRLAIIPFLIIAITFIAFILVDFSPSDPAEVALRINAVIPTEAAIAELRQELGLNAPFFQRYIHWISSIIHFDFGQSFLTKQSVLEELKTAFPPTIYLASASLFIIFFFSFTIAIICVVFKNTWIDQILRGMAFLLIATPNYWLGLLLIWVFAVHLNIFPVSGMKSLDSVILPALTLSITYIGTYLRLIRGTMLLQINQPYVIYARARGISEKKILLSHVLPNSLHTSLVALGMSIPKLVAGTIVIESIFAWPGIGRLCINAIFGRDYPVIQAYVLIMAILFLLFNLFSDILQKLLDPRLKNI